MINFAWKHQLVNIHGVMIVDILHQLLKGIIMNMIEWTQILIDDITPIKRKRRFDEALIEEAPIAAQLDHRFDAVPSISDLQHFSKFSKITQWSGNEQKDILRIFVPVVAPFLTGKCPAAMLCVRAICDFATMAQYRSHDEETLRYLEHALYRIDKLKRVFGKSRPKDNETGQPTFNFPKWHVMTHYVEHIKQFGSADGMDTSHSEAAHRYLVKAFFDRTNKKDGYLDQIAQHNTRRLNSLAMKDIELYRQSRKGNQVDKEMTVQVSSLTRALDLSSLDWSWDEEEMDQLQAVGRSYKTWREAFRVADVLHLHNFLDALAVFIRESRYKLEGVRTSNANLYRRETDSSWAGSHLISIHKGIKCWIRDGKDSSDLEALKSEIIRCAPSWMRSRNWRRDYVWVQENSAGECHGTGNSRALEGRLIGHVQLIVSIVDHARRDSRGKHPMYSGVLLDLLRPRNNGQPNEIHGMIEMKTWPRTHAKSPRNLNGRRFYDLSMIMRSAHLIPSGINSDVFYVNNYIDWDQFNTLYDEEFLAKGIRAADTAEKQISNQSNRK